MSTESKNSKEEIQSEINKELNELLASSFSNVNYDTDLRNLIKSIGFITSGILQSIDSIESDIRRDVKCDKAGNSSKGILNVVDVIRDKCFCIDTLCELAEQKINPNDFVIIQNLIFDQTKLSAK